MRGRPPWPPPAFSSAPVEPASPMASIEELRTAEAAEEAATVTASRHVEGTPLERVVFWAGVALALFHIWANTVGLVRELTLTAVHWGGFAFLCAVLVPARRRDSPKVLVLDLALGALAFACAVYAVFAFDPLYERGVRFVWSDWLFSALAVLLALEFARRAAGWFIPVLALVGLSYVWWLGPYLPGVFRFPGLSLETVLFRSYFEVSGMFGDIARISATYVFMFVLFGAFLLRSGAGEFVIDLARVAAGRMIGGPGLVAVLGSALMGTISGSAVANTVSTGVITIPLMKRAGFPPKFAAGVEAAASTGGQLMPPIMGAGAFVMANYTQIPYLQIAAVSVLPALLYFFSVGAWVRITAKKEGLGAHEEEVPRLADELSRGGVSFLLPIAVLIGMLLWGFTPTYAAGAGMLAVIVGSWLGPRPMGPKAVLEALALGARNMVTTAMLLVTIGLVVMVVATTGLGNTISLMLADWAGGSLLVALVLVALASLVLGMGLPVTASYIVLATLSAPALTQLIDQNLVLDLMVSGRFPEAAKGIFLLADPAAAAKLAGPLSYEEAVRLWGLVPPEFRNTVFEQALPPEVRLVTLLSAHMIIFWLSQDSNVTPPVCLAAFAAAAIAKTPPMETGFTAWRIAKGLYIVPVLFAYTPYLSGDLATALEITLLGALAVYALAAAWEGFAEWPLARPTRVVLVVCGVTLLWPAAAALHYAAAAGVVAVLALDGLVLRRLRGA